MTSDITLSIVSKMHPQVSSLVNNNYNVSTCDYFIGIGTLTSNIVISLPVSPSVGEQYIIKDVSGSVGIDYTATIDGYGNNIDGLNSFILAQPYSSITVIYTGLQWSVCLSYAGNQNGNGYGVYSNLPKQGQSGRTYYATDTGTFMYDDGISWKPFGHDGALTPVKSSDFNWQNQTGATAIDFGTGMFIQAPTASGVRFMYKSLPSTPYTVTAKFIHLGNFTLTDGMIYGIGWGDGTGLITAHINDNINAMNLNVSEWNTPTSFNADIYAYNFRDVVDRMEWFRLSDDGINKAALVSRDGINFVEIYNSNHSHFITPTQVGIVIGTSSGGTALLSCVSFDIE